MTTDKNKKNREGQQPRDLSSTATSHSPPRMRSLDDSTTTTSSAVNECALDDHDEAADVFTRITLVVNSADKSMHWRRTILMLVTQLDALHTKLFRKAIATCSSHAQLDETAASAQLTLTIYDIGATAAATSTSKKANVVSE